MERKLTKCLVLLIAMCLFASTLNAEINYTRYSLTVGEDQWLINHPNFEGAIEQASGTTGNFDITVGGTFGLGDRFAFDFYGYIYLPEDGSYTFWTNSDDGSLLWLDDMAEDNFLVDNRGWHGGQDREGSLGLPAGFHEIRVKFYEDGGGEALTVSYAGPGIPRQTIPANVLFASIDSYAPIVDAGLNQSFSILEKDTTALNATVNDDDMAGTTIAWSSNPATGVSFDSTSIEDPTVSFTTAGIYELTLSVTDSDMQTVNDTVTIRVRENDNPLAWWKLDEGTGIDVADSSGNGYNGTLHGPYEPNWVENAWLTPEYNDSYSLEFYGYLNNSASMGYVEVLTPSDQADPINNISEEITIALWVKPDDLDTDWQPVITKGDGGGWRIHRDGNNSYLTLSNEGWDNLVSSTNIRDGYWHHVVLRYTGYEAAFYIDGQLDVSRSQDPGTFITNTRTLTIGATLGNLGGDNENQAFRSWNGWIDDVRIYDFAIDLEGEAGTDTVAGLYAMGNPNTLPSVVIEKQFDTVVGTPKSIMVDATVTDDGYPVGNPIDMKWTVTAQPDGSTVTFDDDTIEDPTVTFDMNGTYTLRLDAGDGMFGYNADDHEAYDTIDIIVKDTVMDSAIAYYTLDGDVADTVGTNDGSIVGDPVFVDGVFGQALEFDATDSDQVVNCGTFNPVGDNNSMTVAAWVKWGGMVGTYQGFCGKRQGWDANTMMFQIETHPNNVGHLRASNPNAGIDTGEVLPIDKWVFVTFSVYKGTAYMYLNGKLLNSGGFNFSAGVDAPFLIGASGINAAHDGAEDPFDGAIDELVVFDNALSPAEVGILFNTNCMARKLSGQVLGGDANGDCYVNLVDFALLAGNWLESN